MSPPIILAVNSVIGESRINRKYVLFLFTLLKMINERANGLLRIELFHDKKWGNLGVKIRATTFLQRKITWTLFVSSLILRSKQTNKKFTS